MPTPHTNVTGPLIVAYQDGGGIMRRSGFTSPRHDGRVTVGKRVRLLRRTKARIAPGKPKQSRKRQTGRVGKRAVENGFMQSKRVKKLLYIGLDVHKD